MKLLYYPNKLLETPTIPVTEFGESLKKELEEMQTIMVQYKGLGLAANQVGLSKSMFLFKDTKNEIHTIINPKIISSEGRVSISEGCLSAPSVYFNVVRPETIEFTYQNENGEKQNAIAYGMDARIIQHEYDHLQGIFYFDKVNRATRKAAISKLRKELK